MAYVIYEMLSIWHDICQYNNFRKSFLFWIPEFLIVNQLGKHWKSIKHNFIYFCKTGHPTATTDLSKFLNLSSGEQTKTTYIAKNNKYNYKLKNIN